MRVRVRVRVGFTHLVKVSMLSAALLMFVCGWRVLFLPTWLGLGLGLGSGLGSGSGSGLGLGSGLR